MPRGAIPAFPSSLVFLVSVSVNPRVNGTGLAAKTLVTLRKEGVRGMGAAWGWLCRSGGGENLEACKDAKVQQDESYYSLLILTSI